MSRRFCIILFSQVILILTLVSGYLIFTYSGNKPKSTIASLEKNTKPKFHNPELEGWYYLYGFQRTHLYYKDGKWRNEILGAEKVYSEFNRILKKGKNDSRIKYTPLSGDLVSTNTIEFQNANITGKNLLAHFKSIYSGSELAATEDDLITSFSKLLESRFKPTDKYILKWEILEDEMITVKSTFPIIMPWSDKQHKEILQFHISEKQLDFFALGEYQKLCGRKISNKAELEGWQAYDKGEYWDSFQLFVEACQEQKNNPYPYLALALCMTQLSQFSDALEICKMAKSRITKEWEPMLSRYLKHLKYQIEVREIANADNEIYDRIIYVANKLPEIDISSSAKDYFSNPSEAEIQQMDKVFHEFRDWKLLSSILECKPHTPPLPIDPVKINMRGCDVTSPFRIDGDQGDAAFRIIKFLGIYAEYCKYNGQNKMAFLSYCKGLQIMRHLERCNTAELSMYSDKRFLDQLKGIKHIKADATIIRALNTLKKQSEIAIDFTKIDHFLSSSTFIPNEDIIINYIAYTLGVPSYDYFIEQKKLTDAKIALIRDGMLMKYNNNYDPPP